MTKEKCCICGEDIERGFMDKLVGTIVRKDKKVFYICNSCQKEYKNSLKDKIK